MYSRKKEKPESKNKKHSHIYCTCQKRKREISENSVIADSMVKVSVCILGNMEIGAVS
jgi:hypothetical protein